VPRGVVYGFLGPNGAGKTTTMRILTGLIRADEGTVELLGQPYTALDRERLFDVGALIESPAFYPYLSGRDNLRVIAATGPPVTKSRVDEVLALVGLAERGRDPFGTYSLGMKQRLGIASTLLNDPRLLLLDEPANGLDPGGIVAMRQTLRDLATAGKTVFVSSHILPEIQQMADRVAIVHRGRLVREGPLSELLDTSGEIRVRVGEDQVVRAAEVLAVFAGPGADLVHADGEAPGWLRVSVNPDRAHELNRALVSAGVDVHRLEAGSDLERIFLSLTQD
jgi:ABC-2 type transport system ATP-binding protein